MQIIINHYICISCINCREYKTVLRRLLIFILISAVFFIANSGYAYKLQGCGAECKTCHKLKKEEAEKILKNFNVHIIEADSSPIKGLWRVKVEQEGKTFPIYIHYSKKYVFSGDIIDVLTKKKVVAEISSAEQQTETVDYNSIPLKDSPVVGDSTAKNKVIVFTDPDCPFCRLLHKEMKKIVSMRKDIAFYLKLYPLAMHPDAYRKSNAIICEKSSKVLDNAFDGKNIPPPKCETTAIDDNIKLARRLGIGGTPTLILKDSSIIPGYKDAESLIKLIDNAK